MSSINHLASFNFRAKFDRLSEIKIGELGSRIDEFHVEFEEMRKEMEGQVGRYTCKKKLM